MRPFAQRSDQQCANAANNRGIRKIEGRPMISAQIKIEKIRHHAIFQTVNRVTNCTADDRREAELLKQVVIAPKPNGQTCQNVLVRRKPALGIAGV